MLSPAHVGALRYSLLERLRKHSSHVGLTRHLMCDIVSYIPKPVLTLDCCTEEIVLNIGGMPNFIFTNDGVVFGIFQCGSSVVLQPIFPSGRGITLMPELSFFPNVTPNTKTLFYYAAHTRHLYILRPAHFPSPVYFLFDYNVEANEVRAFGKIPEVSSVETFPTHMVVIEDEVFVAVSRSGRSEIWHTVLGASQKVILIWSAKTSGDRGEVLSLVPGFASPQTTALSVVILDASVTYTFALERVRTTSPTVFKSTKRRPLANGATCSVDSLIVGSNTFRQTKKSGQYFLISIQPEFVSDDFCLPNPSYATCPAACDRAGNIYFVVERSSRSGNQQAPLSIGFTDEPPVCNPWLRGNGRYLQNGADGSATGSRPGSSTRWQKTVRMSDKRPVYTLGQKLATTTGNGPGPTPWRRRATTTGNGPGPTTWRRPATTTGNGPGPTPSPRPATTTGNGPGPTTWRRPVTTTGNGPGPTPWRRPGTTTGNGPGPTTWRRTGGTSEKRPVYPPWLGPGKTPQQPPVVDPQSRPQASYSESERRVVCHYYLVRASPYLHL